MTNEEIMQALRCRARHEKATNEGCKKCPYWATENLEEWQKLCGWASCEVYQIISDAADAIERLTAENVALREKVYSMSGEWCAMMSVWNSMGSYDRLRELAEADKDGRVVVLPCKVGDTIWRLKRTFETYPDRSKPYVEPDAFLLQDVWDAGKTVFLTREEAEKALEAMKDG